MFFFFFFFDGPAHILTFSVQSIYTSPTPEASSESPPIKSPEESPELFAIQLSYPPPEDPGASRFLDQKILKFEDFPDEFSLASGSHLDGAPFSSPVDSVATTSSSASSSASAFPLFTGAETAPDTTGDSHLWAPSGHEFKPADMPLDNFGILSTYEVVEPAGGGGIPNFVDNPNLDFNLYDNYTFQGISDDALASLAEPYNI